MEYYNLHWENFPNSLLDEIFEIQKQGWLKYKVVCMEGGCWNIIYLRILGHIYWKTIILNIILIEILKFWHIFAHFCSKYGNFWKFIARFWGRFIIFRLRNGAYLFSICRITTPVQKDYIRCDLKVVFDFGDLWIHRSALLLSGKSAW